MKKVVGLAAKARSGKDTGAAILLLNPEVTAYALADPLKRGCQALFNLTDAQTWDDNAKELKVEAWGLSPREFFQRVGTEWMRAHNPVHWLMRADREIYAPEAITPLSPAQLSHPELPFILGAKAFFNLSDKQCWDEDATKEADSFWNMTPAEMIDFVKAEALKDFPDFFERRASTPSQKINDMAYIKKPILDTEGKSIVIIKDIRFENEAAYIRNLNGAILHIVRDNAEIVKSHSSEFGIEVRTGDIVIKNNGTLIEYQEALDEAWKTLLKIIQN
ncbi:deoxynucleotide monophosphate kinase [Pseudomonas lundensis]|uniref:deoxynucleotide monophosphate kinase family protein n=1 Tax=Pseudomonas lundensis TaxID=86185 RepID=UPI000BA1D1BB|nr:deoxynucleotide monophosphate kinase [Pseudomonas lundensis]OZY35148.1 deoxynucleotide monophosphate kinase [Pseudomonas lundensis]